MKNNLKAKRFFVPPAANVRDKESQYADTKKVSAPMVSHKRIKINLEAGL